MKNLIVRFRYVWLFAWWCFCAATASAQVKVEPLNPPVAPIERWHYEAPQQKVEGEAGYVVYLSRVPVKGGPQRQPFDIVVRRGRSQLVAPKQPTEPATRVYRVTPPLTQIVWDPQVSPDGKKLLFKVGWPYEDRSTYRITIYDLESQKLLPGPQEDVSYYKVEWSPDSRSVAYVVGGTREGDFGAYDEVLSLYAFDVHTGQTRKLTSKLGVTSFSWTTSSTLLFVAFAPELVARYQQAFANQQAPSSSLQRSSIVEVAATGGEPRLVIENAYGNLRQSGLPPLAASPDNKWIAFYGWPDAQIIGVKDPQKLTPPDNQKQYPRLYLINRSTGQKLEVDDLSATKIDFLLWTSNERFVLTREDYKKTTNGSVTKAQIKVYDLPSQTRRDVVTLRAESAGDFSFLRSAAAFQTLRALGDNVVIFRTLRTLPQDSPSHYPALFSILRVDLQDGSASPLGGAISKFGSSIGIDWTKSLCSKRAMV